MCSNIWQISWLSFIKIRQKCIPIQCNIELPCRVPWQRGYVNSRERSSRDLTEENVWVKLGPKFHQGKQFVRSDLFCFIKLSCLRFLWLGPSVRFTTKWHLFLTISWRLLLFNVLGNMTFKNYMKKWCLQPRYVLRGWIYRTTYLH